MAETGDGSTSTDPTGVPETGMVDSTGVPETGIVGTWIGYVDGGGALPSGSDRVELRITAVGVDGQITGTVSFGEPGTMAPATDPDVGYPDSFDPELPEDAPFERFAYALSGSYDDGTARLETALQLGEIWVDWCALQTSYAVSEESYGCIPNCGFSAGDDECALPDDCPFLPGPLDCGKLELCFHREVCECDAMGCTNGTVSALTLDLHRDGDELQGPVDELGTAFLTRE